MKSLPLPLAFIVLLAFTTAMNAQEQSGEQAVRTVVADFAGAINRGDAKALAALFTEDADFVVITGKYLKGRDEIVTYHARLFTDDFQDSHLNVTSVAIRFLRTDVRVARVATQRTENGGKEMRTSFPMFVLTKQGESWLIAAAQNTLTGGPPVPPVGTPKLTPSGSRSSSYRKSNPGPAMSTRSNENPRPEPEFLEDTAVGRLLRHQENGMMPPPTLRTSFIGISK